eukprot:SAG22_NODE_483_length_9925_cov_3.568186_3_plen_188_part_00
MNWPYARGLTSSLGSSREKRVQEAMSTLAKSSALWTPVTHLRNAGARRNGVAAMTKVCQRVLSGDAPPQAMRWLATHKVVLMEKESHHQAAGVPTDQKIGRGRGGGSAGGGQRSRGTTTKSADGRGTTTTTRSGWTSKKPASLPTADGRRPGSSRTAPVARGAGRRDQHLDVSCRVSGGLGVVVPDA